MELLLASVSNANPAGYFYGPNVMLALFAAAVLQQDSLLINLVSRGETVESIVRSVSKSTGVPLATVPETGQEIVLVSLRSAPIKEFKDGLATAVGGTWKEDHGVNRLIRTRKQFDDQAAAERKLRIDEVKTGLANLKKRMDVQPTFDTAAAHALAVELDAINTKYKGHLSDSPGLEARIALEPRTPTGRLVVSIVGSLTPEEIADVGLGERIVYSTTPTSVQRSVTADLSALINRYESEHQTYADELKRFPVGQGFAQRSGDEREIRAADVSQVVFATERSPYNPNLTVRLSLVRRDGTIMASATSLLDLGESKRTDSQIGSDKVELSASSIAFMGAIDQLQKGKTFMGDKNLLAMLGEPEKFDPLSFVAADGVFGLAKDKNVIACIPDDGFVEPAFMAMADPKHIDLAKFSNWLTNKCEVTATKDWFVASPRRKALTRELRVDRHVMGQFFRTSIENGGVSLDATSDMVSKMPRDYMDSIVPMMAFFLLPDLNAGVSDRNIEILRVYGQMTQEQRLAMKNGQPISVSVLSAASKAELNHLIFRADSPLDVATFSLPGQPNSEPVDTISSEITVALPRGIPDRATLSMTSNSANAVLLDGGSSPSANYMPMTAESLAYVLFSGQKADPTDKREQVHIERYRYGQTRALRFNLSITENISSNSEFHETSFPRKSESIPYAQLPDAFKKAVADAMTQLKKQPNSGSGPTKVPPPLR